MSGDRTSSGKDAARVARAARLATALRENLKRRKAQVRGRASSTGEKELAEKSAPGRRRDRPE